MDYNFVLSNININLIIDTYNIDNNFGFINILIIPNDIFYLRDEINNRMIDKNISENTRNTTVLSQFKQLIVMIMI